MTDLTIFALAIIGVMAASSFVSFRAGRRDVIRNIVDWLDESGMPARERRKVLSKLREML